MQAHNEIRAAQAGDAADAVPLIYSSGPAMFEYAFTDRNHAVQDYLRLAFARGRSLFGYEIHHVAVQNGAIVGIYGVYQRKEGKQRSHRVIPEVLRHYGLVAGVQTLLRGLKAEGAVPPPPTGRLYICHVGVRDDLRGQGLGTALIEHAVKRCKGSLVPALDVAKTNPGAKRLYERLGFKVVAERPGATKDLPPHFYMELQR